MSTVEELFGSSRVMAILRNRGPAESVRLAETAWDLGIDLVEVPIQVPEALPSLEAVVAAGRERGRPVGAGTIIDLEQLGEAQRVGVAFTVAPGLDTDVVLACEQRGLVHLPGVATASEVQAAVRLGCRWLKAFPADVLGPAWFRGMTKGPFPGCRFVATGGMDARVAPRYLEAGASLVAVGSALEDPSQLEQLAELVRPA